MNMDKIIKYNKVKLTSGWQCLLKPNFRNKKIHHTSNKLVDLFLLKTSTIVINQTEFSDFVIIALITVDSAEWYAKT